MNSSDMFASRSLMSGPCIVESTPCSVELSLALVPVSCHHSSISNSSRFVASNAHPMRTQSKSSIVKTNNYPRPKFPSHVCKHKKEIYALKQALPTWFHHISSSLCSYGLPCSHLDTSFTL